MEKLQERLSNLSKTNNIQGYTSAEMSPVFKLAVFEGTVEGIQVYDFEGNRIPIEIDDCLIQLRLEYPNIWGIININDDRGCHEETIKLEYSDGKLIRTF